MMSMTCPCDTQSPTGRRYKKKARVYIPVSYGIYTLYKVQLSIAALILLSLM